MVRGIRKDAVARILPDKLTEGFQMNIQILGSGNCEFQCRKQSAEWLINPIGDYILSPDQRKQLIDALSNVFQDPMANPKLLYLAGQLLHRVIRKANYRTSTNAIGWIVKKGIVESLVMQIKRISSTNDAHRLLLDMLCLICGTNSFAVEKSRNSGILDFLIEEILMTPFENRLRIYISALALNMFDDDQFFDEFISSREKMLQLIFRILNPENSFSVIHMGFTIAFKYICPKKFSRIFEIVENHEIMDCLFEHLMNPMETSFSIDALRCLSKIIEFGADITIFKLIENGFLNSFQKALERTNLNFGLEMIGALMANNHIICSAAFIQEVGINEIIAACYHQNEKTIGVELLLRICQKLPDPFLNEFLTSGAGFALKDVFKRFKTESETPTDSKLGPFVVFLHDSRLKKMAPILGLSELINYKVSIFENKK